MSRRPIPTDLERTLIRRLGQQARELDDEANARQGGSWNAIVRNEIQRAAGVVRLVATLVMNGTYGPERASFWITSTDAYLMLVRRASLRGVIR